MTPAEEIAALREENNRLRMDLATLRPQLLKARRQRHEIHDQLRALMANRRREERDAED